MRIRRALSVIATVDGLRELHAELNQPVRWPQLQRVFDREGIRVMKARIRRRAFVDGSEGVFVITMKNDLPAHQHTKVLLHEYAHIHLHLTDRGEVARQLLACTRGDVREVEADLFAALLWLGPKATPDHPVIARLYAKLESSRFVRTPLAQISLPLTEAAPAFHRSAGPPRAKVGSRRVDQVKPRLPGSRIGVGASHDSLRYKWSDDKKLLTWFHYDLGWIEVRDGMRVGNRIVICAVGDPRAVARVFVISASDRRRLSFSASDTHGWSVAELDAQILRARPLGARSADAGSTRLRQTSRGIHEE